MIDQLKRLTHIISDTTPLFFFRPFSQSRCNKTASLSTPEKSALSAEPPEKGVFTLPEQPPTADLRRSRSVIGVASAMPRAARPSQLPT